jgi:hypothetical protein
MKTGRPQTEETKQKQREAARKWLENLKSDPTAWNEYRRKQAEGTARRYQNKEENRVKYLTETPFEKLGGDARREKIIFDQKINVVNVELVNGLELY